MEADYEASQDGKRIILLIRKSVAITPWKVNYILGSNIQLVFDPVSQE